MDLFTFHTLMMGNTKLERHSRVLALYEEAVSSSAQVSFKRELQLGLKTCVLLEASRAMMIIIFMIMIKGEYMHNSMRKQTMSRSLRLYYGVEVIDEVVINKSHSDIFTCQCPVGWGNILLGYARCSERRLVPHGTADC